MKDNIDEKSERWIRRASKRGAMEDIIHVSSLDEDYELRHADFFGADLKDEIDLAGEEGNARLNKGD